MWLRRIRVKKGNWMVSLKAKNIIILLKEWIIDAVERKQRESDQVAEEDAFNNNQKKTNLSSDCVNKGDNINSRSGKKFLRIFLVPVIHITLFPIIQFLVNYQIRQKVLWTGLQRSAKRWRHQIKYCQLPTVMRRQQIQRLSTLFGKNWKEREM